MGARGLASLSKWLLLVNYLQGIVPIASMVPDTSEPTVQPFTKLLFSNTLLSEVPHFDYVFLIQVTQLLLESA